METRTGQVVGVVVGVLLGAGAFAVGVGPALALGLVVVYCVGGVLMATYFDALPGEDSGAAARRWSSASLVVTVLAAATASVGSGLPTLRAVALGALVFGTGWVGELFGVAMATGREEIEE